CPDCHGSGYLAHTPGRPLVDPYTYEPHADSVPDKKGLTYGYDVDPRRKAVLGEAQLDAADERRRRDASLARLEAARRAEKGEVDPREAYAWERVREAMEAAGDYKILRRLLERM